MTLPAPLDDALAVTEPAGGPTPLERLWAGHSGRAPRGVVARVFGVSPVSAADRPAFAEAVVELQVTQRLRVLAAAGESWRVLHAVPLGDSELDHLVIGPAGVFAVTVDRPGAVSAAEALLSAALGRAVPVASVVIAVPPRRSVPQATLGHGGPDTVVLRASRLVAHLRSQPPRLSVDEVRELTRAALAPRTWGARPARSAASGTSPLPTRDALASWFVRVRDEVDRARRVQATWAAAGSGVLVALALSGPGIAGAFGS